jgi:hypothetical protein
MRMRFAMRLLALAAAMLGAAASPSPSELANVAAANGHAAAVHLRATGERTIDGRRVTVTIDQLGTLRLFRRCVDDVCGGWWFDGRRRWSYGLNAVPFPDLDDALTPVRRTLAAIVSYAFAEPAFRAEGGSADASGAFRWRVRAPQGAVLFAELDPATLALRRVRDENGDVLAEYGREVRAGGAVFALGRRGLDEQPADTVEAVDGPLAPPDGVPATFAGSPRLALGDELVPVVPCTIAGRAARCLLDTGSTPSALALPLIEALHLEPRGELEIAAFSRFATGFVETGPLTLGAAHFARARFAVVPAVRGQHFDVVVGADLLARVHLVLDRAGAFALVEAPRAAAQRGGVPLLFESGVPHIDAVLGGVAERALLDTGDAATVSLGYAQYRRGPQWPIVGHGLASGVGGAADAFTVEIPELRLGGESLGPTRAEVNRVQDGVHVGIGVWKRCVVDIDLSFAEFGCTVHR